MDSFTTRFGRSITFLPGYRSKYAKQISASRNAYQYNAAEISRPASFYSFAKDAFEYALMMELVEQAGVRLRGVRALDIGGMEGTVSRLIKAEGVAREAHCVDIHDYSAQLPTERFRSHLRRLQVMSTLAPAFGRYNFQEHFDYPVTRASRYHGLREAGNAGCEIDAYHTCGLYGLDSETPFDFVSALLCLPYFTLLDFYTKLAQLIRPGGHFFVLSDYWWSMNNSTGLIGNFPWCAQRLDETDLFRYFGQEHADESSIATERFRYYHGGKDRPTLSEHIAVAQAQGFTLLACRRHLARSHDGERHLVTPDEIEAAAPLSDVLTDIAQFRGGVCEADLRTAFVSAVFVRQA